MAFVQIIELRTSDIDAIRQAEDEWMAATEGRRTLRRQLLCQDRNDPGRYLAIASFDSHEPAMENSNLPETQASAETFASLTEGTPVFHDLDVIDERS